MTFPWQEITWVLLDMDGTLLDKHFDDYFWETLVPEEYALRQGLALADARDLVFARYKSQEGTLNWTDIDFWSRELELDIPALKEGIRHLIEVHPDTEDFLKFLREKGKKVALVTNAHTKTLALKMDHTGLLGYFDEVVSSFDLGAPKEDVRFWEILQERLGFDPGARLAGGRQRRGPGRGPHLRHQVPLLQGQIQLPAGGRIPPGFSLHRRLFMN